MEASRFVAYLLPCNQNVRSFAQKTELWPQHCLHRPQESVTGLCVLKCCGIVCWVKSFNTTCKNTAEWIRHKRKYKLLPWACVHMFLLHSLKFANGWRDCLSDSSIGGFNTLQLKYLISVFTVWIFNGFVFWCFCSQNIIIKHSEAVFFSYSEENLCLKTLIQLFQMSHVLKSKRSNSAEVHAWIF